MTDADLVSCVSVGDRPVLVVSESNANERVRFKLNDRAPSVMVQKNASEVKCESARPVAFSASIDPSIQD
jgi:hypothetical protein